MLLVGDYIRDEYVYVSPLGKASKENIIATRYESKEVFAGGVKAASRHLHGLCESVRTVFGRRITVKRRFVDPAARKIFEVHEEVEAGETQAAPDYAEPDLVIVTDFGHGCITPQMILEMSDRAKFLAVNAQTNSANHGFNLITKYPRADYAVVDELEARLAVHDRDGPLEGVIEKLGFPKIAVTRGKDGALGYDGSFHYAPAVADKVLDTMGAGDAFFCVTAPFACAGADMPTLLKIGNAAGAVKCGVIGHRQSVTREALLEQLGR
ncbi:MAG TPA: PfkB family carbohydrate kinase [Candidatus Binatia bacterium]|nr:PfkB family carbohydrate kinase [Candidatus Binatia bacterium]